mmetsp:Transcript_57707/g.174498  ORF Transcript_57707/g.174498 Transcript_57707/m.174498 type:complete len:300 (+) Transcript_57707:170-1069(+)
MRAYSHTLVGGRELDAEAAIVGASEDGGELVVEVRGLVEVAEDDLVTGAEGSFIGAVEEAVVRLVGHARGRQVALARAGPATGLSLGSGLRHLTVEVLFKQRAGPGSVSFQGSQPLQDVGHQPLEAVAELRKRHTQGPAERVRSRSVDGVQGLLDHELKLRAIVCMNTGPERGHSFSDGLCHAAAKRVHRRIASIEALLQILDPPLTRQAFIEPRAQQGQRAVLHLEEPRPGIPSQRRHPRVLGAGREELQGSRVEARGGPTRISLGSNIAARRQRATRRRQRGSCVQNLDAILNCSRG